MADVNFAVADWQGDVLNAATRNISAVHSHTLLKSLISYYTHRTYHAYRLVHNGRKDCENREEDERD